MRIKNIFHAHQNIQTNGEKRCLLLFFKFSWLWSIGRGNISFFHYVIKLWITFVSANIS